MFHCSTTYNSQDMKQPKCPWAEEWIKKMGYIHSGKSLNHKNEIMPFAATWMQLEIIILSKPDKTNVI